jgi:hypothetical protein
MVRKSKYEMLDMELANKMVFDQAKARFPLGIDEYDVTGKLYNRSLSVKI